MREASQTNSYRRHKYLVNMSDYERSVECYVLIEIYNILCMYTSYVISS